MISLSIKKKAISIWLLPTKDDTVYLSKIIKDLAKRYGAYQFSPHLTLYAGLQMDEVEAKDIFKKAVKDIDVKPFTVKIKNINYSSAFSKTLFLAIENNQWLQKLYSALKKHLQVFNDYSFKPHIGLIYKNNMLEAEKLKVIKRLNVKKSLLMEKIVLISADKSISVERDVKGWKQILTNKLSYG